MSVLSVSLIDPPPTFSRAPARSATGDTAKQSAIDYAKARAKFGHGEIRVLNNDDDNSVRQMRRGCRANCIAAFTGFASSRPKRAQRLVRLDNETTAIVAVSIHNPTPAPWSDRAAIAPTTSQQR
jgi:hypothetical protein